MSKAPEEPWQEMLDEALRALDEGRHHDALQLCDRAAMMGSEARYHAAILRGDTLLGLGDASGALSTYETVADPARADPVLDCARGVALFELGKLAEAENALQSALRGDESLADAHYTLGLIAELRGTGQEAEYFRSARKLDPAQFSLPPSLSREAFEKSVDDAVAALPAPLQEALNKLPLLISDLPHINDVEDGDPPLSPFALGVYVGPVPFAIDTVMDAPYAAQPVMVLFKRNVERAAEASKRLVQEIRDTLVFEVGYALGYKDEELEDMIDNLEDAAC